MQLKPASNFWKLSGKKVLIFLRLYIKKTEGHKITGHSGKTGLL